MTDKQKRFVAEYIRDSNGKQAAIRAGYAPSGAAKMASRLLKEPSVREALKGIVKDYAGVEPEEVLRELRSVAFSQASDENGSRMKFSSKLKALELLGKNLGLFEQGAGKQVPEPVRIIEINEDLG